MSMNFDKLPDTKPAGFVVPEGTYKGIIADAKMMQAKDTTKPMYLNYKIDLYNYKTGEKVGSIFDSQFESEKNLVLYKLKRFMLATDIKLAQFELSDLAKLINGKELLVDVKTDHQEGKQDRSVVDATKNAIYYPLSEANTVFGDDTEIVINASDSVEQPATITEADVEDVF